MVQLWPGDILKCVSCVFRKKHAAFKWKHAICEFPVSPGSAEALDGWGGKVKYLLIAYILSNTCAKNYQHRFMYVTVIARQSSDILGGHSVIIAAAAAVDNAVAVAAAACKWWRRSQRTKTLGDSKHAALHTEATSSPAKVHYQSPQSQNWWRQQRTAVTGLHDSWL